jgi:hypothetical protein
VQAHGYIRRTHDLDIIIQPRPLNLSRLSEALAELEAELRLPGTYVTRAGPLDVHNIEHVAGGPRSYDALRKAALEIDLRGRNVTVVGLSDLIRMKRAAGRDQDLMDIEALTRDAEST